MKRILMGTICFLLTISITVSGNSNISTNLEGDSSKNNANFGLNIDGKDFSIPSTLKELINDGWKISDKKPYFLSPLVGEDYYNMRTDWSLSKDGESILKGGTIIRLLEKEGVFLEVTITNQNISEDDEPHQKIEEGIVNSIVVFYDKTHTSIKLNNKELKSLTPDILIRDYPLSDGWTHVPTNYRNHPEFKISIEYMIVKNIDNYEKSITIYFDLENKAFKINILNQMPYSFFY